MIAAEFDEVVTETSLGVVAVDPAVEVQVEAGRKSPIVVAITQAETITSVEFRVHMTQKFWDPKPLASAKDVFLRLGMYETQLRNGVLIYLNIKKKKAAIFGDEGIHLRLGDQWQPIVNRLIDDLRSTHIENAVAKLIEDLSMKLKPFFPARNQRDELPNTVSVDPS